MQRAPQIVSCEGSLCESRAVECFSKQCVAASVFVKGGGDVGNLLETEGVNSPQALGR